MERSELEIIKELMAELESKMEPSEEDLSERLGRGKPEVKILKVEGEVPGDEGGDLEEGEEIKELEGEGEMGPLSKVLGDDDEGLKARLMRLRA